MVQFKTRARALDMLGRQQIAGVPTAISELFKNAHDAYADRVEVDFYRHRNLFVLRDDGVGMTKIDFESRWLTLGTESKLTTNGMMGLPPPHPNKPLRPILGEKGIGRLAIGVIGPQVLVLSRAVRDEIVYDLVVAFLNWRLFEVPGIDLNQIDIPVRTFSDGRLPTQADIAEIVQEFGNNLAILDNLISPELHQQITNELAIFSQVDPSLIDSYLRRMTLTHYNTGTHFYITPTYESLAADLDGNREDNISSPLVRVLIGFTNTMTPNHDLPCITPSFRDYKNIEAYDELIGPREFWTPEEATSADHHISGRFDQYGQFQGEVSIYGHASISHVIPWAAAQGKPTDCGPFEIDFAYVQGAARESRMIPEQWARIDAKLASIGGLYIYRDGIRVLPYGTHEYDWLNLERNRTKSAGYYYWSYRRLFGAIKITHDQNSTLSEKAGREGFRENKAYRQFKAILQNFFLQMAADFFREGGTYTDIYEQEQTIRREAELARRKREKQVNAKKKILSNHLTEFFDRLKQDQAQETTNDLLESLQRDLRDATLIPDQEHAGATFIDIEADAIRRLEGIRISFKVVKPRGIGLSKDLNRDWEAYQREYEILETTVFAPTRNRINELVGQLASEARLSIDKRRRLDRSLRDLTANARKTVQSERRETEKTAADIKDKVVDLSRQSLIEVEAATKQVLTEFARTDISSMPEEILVDTRERLENTLLDVLTRNQGVLENVREQLQALELYPDEDGRIISSIDITQDMEQRLLQLQDQASVDLELTQLGMALEVVNHEFDATVRSIRNDLRRLKAWADVNQGLEKLYNNIRANFDHLDGYLTLFTPLHRRLYRNKIEVSGADIGDFLRDLFSERLIRHSTKLEQTQRFRRLKLLCYPSTFYPVFVNLVDNAIYWLKNQPEPRVIQLDADDTGFIVSDNGPGIEARDRMAVFELGFSRKPAGRGMGLYIAKRALAEAKYDLVYDPGFSAGATFRLIPNNMEKG